MEKAGFNKNGERFPLRGSFLIKIGGADGKQWQITAPCLGSTYLHEGCTRLWMGLDPNHHGMRTPSPPL